MPECPNEHCPNRNKFVPKCETTWTPQAVILVITAVFSGIGSVIGVYNATKISDVEHRQAIHIERANENGSKLDKIEATTQKTERGVEKAEEAVKRVAERMP